MKNIKRLPSGFRHFFSQKEIRKLEELAGIRFGQISFGHLLNTTTFEQEQLIQSNLHPLRISAFKRETDWIFRIHQSGFRNEMLPAQFEAEAKADVGASIIAYINQIITSKETDFLNNPQLVVTIQIASNQVKVLTRELR